MRGAPKAARVAKHPHLQSFRAIDAAGCVRLWSPPEERQDASQCHHRPCLGLRRPCVGLRRERARIARGTHARWRELHRRLVFARVRGNAHRAERRHRRDSPYSLHASGGPDPLRISLASMEIDPVFLHTPHVLSESLSDQLEMTVICKVETITPIRSFKGRGADWFFQTAEDPSPVVCASAGNFGQGIAYAARSRGIPCTVFAAEQANPLKVERMRSFGADVRLSGNDFDSAKDAARRHAAELGGSFVEDGAVARTVHDARGGIPAHAASQVRALRRERLHHRRHAGRARAARPPPTRAPAWRRRSRRARCPRAAPTAASHEKRAGQPALARPRAAARPWPAHRQRRHACGPAGCAAAPSGTWPAPRAAVRGLGPPRRDRARPTAQSGRQREPARRARTWPGACPAACRRSTGVLMVSGACGEGQPAL
jgi:hypothetical protein